MSILNASLSISSLEMDGIYLVVESGSGVGFEALIVPAGEVAGCTQVPFVLAVDDRGASDFTWGGVEERRDPLHDFCCRGRTAAMGGLLGEVASAVVAFCFRKR